MSCFDRIDQRTVLGKVKAVCTCRTMSSILFGNFPWLEKKKMKICPKTVKSSRRFTGRAVRLQLRDGHCWVAVDYPKDPQDQQNQLKFAKPRASV